MAVLRMVVFVQTPDDDQTDPQVWAETLVTVFNEAAEVDGYATIRVDDVEEVA